MWDETALGGRGMRGGRGSYGIVVVTVGQAQAPIATDFGFFCSSRFCAARGLLLYSMADE